MITREFYETKMREAIALLDSKVSKKTVDLIYSRIRNDYENEDFDKAIEDAITADNLSYPYLLRQLMQHASARREREASEEKRKAEEDARRFWRMNYQYIKQNICNRKCYECHVQFCDLIARECIANIKLVLLGEKKFEQVTTELAAKFPGVGFETDHLDLQPFLATRGIF